MQRPVALFSLWLAYTAFVVYGSLVPLDWRPMPFDQALAAFRQIPFLTLGIESRADWIANGVLYAPLGFLSASLLLTSRWRLVRGLALPVALAGCLALAVGVEFSQLFFPPRTVSLNDLIAEGIGTLVGVAASPLLLASLRQLQSRWQLGGRALGAALLLVYAIG
ncbi:MAG: VanZ family protein, partial [Burkholderiales bacterium]|nr:VanZ family protein [Burkholderiales bacterium]